MSDSDSPNGREDASIPDGGILAALPRSRPQRVSPRRAAARNATATKPAVMQAPEKSAKTKAASAPRKPAATRKPAVKPAARPVAKPAAKSAAKPAQAGKPARKRANAPKQVPEPPAPKQGYEPEEEFELGSTVNPPSGVELAGSVADIVGELANSGLAAGGRLLKDAFSLLRRS